MHDIQEAFNEIAAAISPPPLPYYYFFVQQPREVETVLVPFEETED